MVIRSAFLWKVDLFFVSLCGYKTKTPEPQKGGVCSVKISSRITEGTVIFLAVVDSLREFFRRFL